MPAEPALVRDSGGEPQARERALATLAWRQHGVVAWRQLRRLGFGEDAIDFRIGSGRLHRVHRAVYAVGHPRLSMRGRWMAAVLACGPDALLSHRSAAALWGIAPMPTSAIEVTVGSDRHTRPGLRVRRAALTAVDRAVCDGIPATSLPRTLLDIAAVLHAPGVERAWRSRSGWA